MKCNQLIIYAAISIALNSLFSSKTFTQDTTAGLNYVDSIMEQLELIPLMINGDKDNRINIVIMNRWTSDDKAPYNNQDMKAEFLEDINNSLIAALTPGHPDAQTAYANYYRFFNAYALWWPDAPEWGTGQMNTETVDEIRDRLFLPWKDEYTGWVTVLIMPNRDGGGGGAARNLEERVGNAVIVGNGIGKMLHEISHTCSSIGDEYTAGATGTSAMPTYNSSLEYRRDKIKWRAWIDPDTPLPTPYTEKYLDKIGAFEGCQYHLTNYFRPSAQGCIMGAGVFDNTEKMCAICQQRLSMRIYKLVNPIEHFYPSETNISLAGSQTIHFSVDLITPKPNTQKIEWILNGNTIANGVDEVDITFKQGKAYDLVFSLTDTTSFIRPDPPFGEFPHREIRWHIGETDTSDDYNPIVLSTEVIAAQTGRDNGKIFLEVQGGKPPYKISWSDSKPEYGPAKRYEAEEAIIHVPGHKIKNFFDASNQMFLSYEGNNGKVIWTINANASGEYPLDFVYSSTEKSTAAMTVSVNNRLIADTLRFSETIPLFTGWKVSSVTTFLNAGINNVILATAGQPGPHIDYLRVPENLSFWPITLKDRYNLAPGAYNVTVKDQNETTIEKTIYLNEEESFEITDLRIDKAGTTSVKIVDPDPGFDYLWYTSDAPVYESEKVERPINRGVEFSPSGSGIYFIGAKNLLNNAESINRISFAITVEVGKEKRGTISNMIIPGETKSARPLLWLDASDLDGDGKQDDPSPARDFYKGWKDKAQGIGGPDILYKPNQMNGKGVAGFEMVWVTGLDKGITDFQTIMMVYRESTVSFPGKSPFIGLNPFLGKSENPEQQLFIDTIAEEVKSGKVYLNGAKVDPFSTPNPMNFCILTVELSSKIHGEIKRTEGYWEGTLAELIVFDGILTFEERQGVEEYLRKKWLSAIHLEKR